MNTKVSPLVIGAAVVILVAFCVFMFIHASNSLGPNQLPPPSDTFKPGYNEGGNRSAGPDNRGQRPAPGATNAAKP